MKIVCDPAGQQWTPAEFKKELASFLGVMLRRKLEVWRTDRGENLLFLSSVPGMAYIDRSILENVRVYARGAGMAYTHKSDQIILPYSKEFADMLMDSFRAENAGAEKRLERVLYLSWHDSEKE